MWLLLHLLASLSLRSRFLHLSLFAWPRFTPPASHPWVSLVSIHCLSFAGQFTCPLVLLFVLWSIPSLTLPCLSSYQLSCCSCWSAIPVFLSLSPLIQLIPHRVTLLSLTFFCSQTPLLNSQPGVAPSVLTTSILDLLQIFFFSTSNPISGSINLLCWPSPGCTAPR